MVQAARSGVQNIAEGSQASGTSKKTELKLTNVAQTTTNQKKTDKMSVRVSESPYAFEPDSVLVANASLSLLNLCCCLLDRQLTTQAEAFENEGGFTERMYRIRTQRRRTK
jgi:four helix bundle suffix protein